MLNFKILRRRYGGDLQRIIDELGYLQDLGVVQFITGTSLTYNPKSYIWNASGYP
jgi:hypothetical protein